MNRRDIVIGVIILLVVGFFIYRSQNVSSPEITELPEVSLEDKVEDRFNVELSENAEKAELVSTTDESVFGVAAREEEGEVLGYSVLTDLPDPGEGEFYQAWIIDESEYVSLGKLSQAKGGWLIDTDMDMTTSDATEVVVTKEKTYDLTPEVEVLRGNF